MAVFPFAMPSALFSDAVDYRFRLRPVRATTNGAGPSFAVGDDERVISVTFGVPQALDGGDSLTQTGTCTLPSSEVVPFQVGDEAGGAANGVRVFAGCRLDPFYIDQAVSGGIRTSRRLPDQLSGKNSLDGQNALGIVVEGDIANPVRRWEWAVVRTGRRDDHRRLAAYPAWIVPRPPRDQELHHARPGV